MLRILDVSEWALRSSVLLALFSFLSIAAWADVRYRRIPNVIVLVGMFVGVLLNGLLPLVLGYTDGMVPGELGWLPAFKGAGYGLLMLLPLYWLRVMGAGDVKLVAMVGAFVGSVSIVGVVLAAFIAGGLMALAVALRRGVLVVMLRNVWLILMDGLVRAGAGQLSRVEKPSVSVGDLPYGVAIAVGTAAYLLWQRGGVMF